jgi:hypothetical protein
MDVTWPTKIINVYKSDLTLIQSSPTYIYELDLNWFHLELRNLEDNYDGMPFVRTHKHNTEVTLGGLTYARVIEVINGYTVTFEDDQYAVNLVGANSNVADVTNVNQVSVRPYNSAGLISTPLIEYDSFRGGITVDVDNVTGNAVSGTVFSAGTPLTPSDNTNDAILIDSVRGFHKFYIKGDITLDSGTDFDERTFIGDSRTKTTITIDSDADVSNCEFYDAEITGTLDGGNVIQNCLVGSINYVNGYIERCILGDGLITLGGGADAHFLDCWDGTTGVTTPEIDMGGSGQSLGVRNYVGDITISNKTGAETVNINLGSGCVTLASTVTNGTVHVEGDGKLVDESGDSIESGTWNGVTIENNTTGAALDFLMKITGNKVTKFGDVITIYEDDGVTTWKQYNLADGERIPV